MMRVSLVTAPTIEPITLAELKLHLRMDSGSFADNIDEVQSLAPASRTASDDWISYVGTGVDVLGYTAVLQLISGTNVATGTVQVKIQESDTDVSANYIDWSGTFEEIMTLDVAPSTAWAVGNTIMGATSGKTCVITQVLTTTTFVVKDRSGTFTLGEVLSNGTYTADQGAANPTFFQLTTGNDNATYEKAYTGTKRYIRTIAKVLNAACAFGTTVIRLKGPTIEDDDLNDAIIDGRGSIENITRRALLTQTWNYYLDNWPDGDFIKLPFGNLASISSVSWKDTDGVETNLTKTITAFAASGTSPITKTAVTSAAHGFSDGDVVSISGTTSYDGGWEISNVTTNTFDILMVFVADDATGYASDDYLVETNGEEIGKIVLPYDESWPSDTLYPSNPIKIRFVCGWTTAALIPKNIKRAVKFAAEDAYYHGNRHEVLEKVINNLLASYCLWDEF